VLAIRDHGNEDVCRFDVAVNDAGRVSLGQRLGDSAKDVERDDLR
jgi:hypothetical protein